MKVEIEFPEEFIEFSKEWHNGQSSMLYAVASTGKLQAIFPREKERMTQQALLFENLSEELTEILQYETLAGEDYMLAERYREFADRSAKAFRALN